jgi:hypothetical protein
VVIAINASVTAPKLGCWDPWFLKVANGTAFGSWLLDSLTFRAGQLPGTFLAMGPTVLCLWLFSAFCLLYIALSVVSTPPTPYHLCSLILSSHLLATTAAANESNNDITSCPCCCLCVFFVLLAQPALPMIKIQVGKKRPFKAGCMVQMIECLPSMCKALGSTTSTIKINK